MARPTRETAALEAGWVVAAHGRRYRVEIEPGVEIECMTRGKRSDVAVGDHVRYAKTGDRGIIETTDPRQTLFYRSDANRQKLIAANATQVVMVVAGSPAFSEDLVNRCLVGAEHAGIRAIIVLNKIDLPETARALETLGPYRRLGYDLVQLSAKSDLSPLRTHLEGHTSVLVGQSGMGKSTIINGLVPHAAARVAEISMALNSGRHTTTHAELYHLGPDSHIIDSPGLQEFGLHHLTPADAAQAFVELRPLLGNCRFRDCKHISEPGCAVLDAAKRGQISQRRFGSYRRLADELSRKRQAWE
ncbi:MAG: Small ribosomal subunit biosis GTPase RsgA [Betaproteobacteria bacterium]|nr:Small ribosomal subunit biosis GTPase RsgA [Betaproteobacteria bacterium]